VREPDFSTEVASDWERHLEVSLRRIDETGAAGLDGFPHFGDPETGIWTESKDGDWTGGFWNGMCWLAAHATSREQYGDWASEWTRKLAPRATSDTVFRGFLFYYGAALGAILFEDESAREIALAGARGLDESFHEVAGVLPLGDAAEEASDVGGTEASIDTVQGAALLVWAGRELGESRYIEHAVRHGHRIADFCLRDDGSVVQSASFDPSSGEQTRRYTHKGIRHDSVWGRAQAWAMIGYAVLEAWAPGHGFLALGQRVADWWIANAPADHVVYWDFDDPAIPETNRDTSATGIAAASLLKLADLADGADAERYRAAAEATVSALVRDYVDERGILGGGCYNRRLELATDNELVWGSYYLFEALNVLSGKLPATAV
jgi:unsaturated chondroitin disaccharide hydrolase